MCNTLINHIRQSGLSMRFLHPFTGSQSKDLSQIMTHTPHPFHKGNNSVTQVEWPIVGILSLKRTNTAFNKGPLETI